MIEALAPLTCQEELIAKIPSCYDAFLKWKYIRLNCPDCNERGKAWINTTGTRWRCNRVGSCGGEGWISEITGKSTQPNRYKYRPSKIKKENHFLQTSQTKEALGVITTEAKAWIRSRLGSQPLFDTAMKMAKTGLLGASKKVKDNWTKQRASEGYELFAPLFLLGSTRAVSGQVRFTGQGGPAPDFKGRALKTKTLAGYSTGEGATFGRSDLVLQRAVKENEPIYLCEGLPDWIAMRALGYKTALGVAGVKLAGRVAKWIGQKNKQVMLILCLDPDKAGDEGLADVKKALRDYPNVQLHQAELPRGEDINDVLLSRSPAAVRNIMTKAVWIQGGVEVEKACKLLRDMEARQKENEELGFHAKPRYLTRAHKNGLRSGYRYLREICDDRWKWFSKLAHSGEHFQWKVEEYLDGSRALAGKRILVSDSPFYNPTSSMVWNFAVCDWLRANLPENLYVGTVHFETRQESKDKRKALLQSANKQHAPDMLCMTDAARSRLVVIIPKDSPDTAHARVGASASDIQEMSRDQAIVERIMPAWFGSSDYLIEQLDAKAGIAHDPWLLKRFNRYAGRGSLSLPGEKAFRDKAREAMKDIRDARDEIEMASGDKPIVDREIFISTNKQSGQVSAITFEPCSFANIVKISEGQFPSFSPQSQGNLLADRSWRDLCIELVEFINKEEQMNLDISEYPGSDRFVEKAQEAHGQTPEYRPPPEYPEENLGLLIDWT